MTTILTSKRAEILIERGKEGMGVCFSGLLPPNPDPEFQEAYDLLEGLVEYLEGDKDNRTFERAFSDVYVHLIALPANTPSWIITATPYTWKGHVVVSQDSLRYYEALYHNLISSAGREKSELLQIVFLRRASCCKDIINGLRKNLV